MVKPRSSKYCPNTAPLILKERTSGSNLIAISMPSTPLAPMRFSIESKTIGTTTLSPGATDSESPTLIFGSWPIVNGASKPAGKLGIELLCRPRRILSKSTVSMTLMFPFPFTSAVTKASIWASPGMSNPRLARSNWIMSITFKRPLPLTSPGNVAK